MAYGLKENELDFVKQLIGNISHFEEDTAIFQHVYKYTVHQLNTADSMFFNTQKDIDRKINGLVEKFIVHGFLMQANEVKKLYNALISNSLSKEETKTILNLLQFLFELSDSPTQYFAQLPDGYQPRVPVEEVEIDWGEYLKTGIERWSPPPYSESDEWTDDENEVINPYLDTVDAESATLLQPEEESILTEEDAFLISQGWMQKIKNSIQTDWFSNSYVCHTPESKEEEARFAFQWYEHLEPFTYGLVNVGEVNIVSEYKLVREVIWQLQEIHNSFAYVYDGDKLMARDDLTIASSRPAMLKKFLEHFIPYFELLQQFRDFQRDVCGIVKLDEKPPNTYRSYSNAVQNILAPTMKTIVDLDIEAMNQDTAMTLLVLADKCRSLVQTAQLLQEIHKKVILDYHKFSPLECASNLLAKLHLGVRFSYTKQEQDIYLCLYLESLFKYLQIIDDWLNDDRFQDELNEFPLSDDDVFVTEYEENKTIKPEETFSINFLKSKLETNVANDGVMQIILKEIFQIGKNIHLLQLLGKLHLLNHTSQDTLYEELVNKVLEKLESHFNIVNCATSDLDLEVIYENVKFPVICKDFCKFSTEMDRLEKLVDTSDGFLTSAFESFLVEKDLDIEKPEISLYERISQITTHTFSTQSLIENVFSNILQERYSQSGILVKTILKNDYLLERHIELLKHVFLFNDDIIFPFYWKLFEKIDDCSHWGNDVWLTSHLQDILMDLYPECYSNVTVIVKSYWEKYIDDPLQACALFKIHYKIEWPVSIIIKNQQLNMYKEMFYFILQIKWALYTLNHLHFSDIEPKGGKQKTLTKSLKILQLRLRILRFGLVNIFTSIQHYILGHAYSQCSKEFEKNYAEANDLDTLIQAHSKFIANFYKMSVLIRDFQKDSFGFKLLLYLVRHLRIMWKDMKTVDDRKLRKCETHYKKCENEMNSIIHPIE